MNNNIIDEILRAMKAAGRNVDGTDMRSYLETLDRKELERAYAIWVQVEQFPLYVY